MEDWDQETLEKVVESKKNEYNPNKPTEIVSSFWLFNRFFQYKFNGSFCHSKHEILSAVPIFLSSNIN